MKKYWIVFYLILASVFYLLVVKVYADERQEVYLYIARNLFEKEEYKEALENYQKAVELGEINPKDMALMAVCYIKNKKFVEAQNLLREEIKKNPDEPFLILAQGILEFDKKNYIEAYKYFSKAYKIDKNLIQAKRGIVSSLVNMGIQSYKTDKKKAEKYFRKALELDNSFVPALQNMAVLEFEKGNTYKALMYINNALRYDPTNRKVLELKYYVYYKKKDYRDQIKVLLKLVIIYPKNPEYWTMLGKAYEATGQIEKSIEAFRNARAYNASNPYPYYSLAKYYYSKKKDKTKALYILKEGIGKAVYLIGHIRLSAMSRLQNNNKGLTKSDLEEIKEMARSIETPRKILNDSLSLLRKLSGNDDKYKRELSNLIDLYPHTVELQIALAQLYTEMKNYKEAIKLWRYILIKHSRNIEAYKGISYCYMQTGDIDRAIKSYKITLDVDPDDTSIYENLITLYKKKGDLESLYNDWKERLYMDKRNPILLRELAKVERLLGKDKDAEKHIKRAEVVEKENREYEEKQREKK